MGKMKPSSQTASRLDEVRRQRDEVLRICRRYGVGNVRIFGSVVRGEETRHSDIDLLLDLPEHFSLLRLSSLVQDLQDVLGSRVQVTSAAYLRNELRSSIMRDAQPM
jgi:uncharacterized protein